MKNNKENKKIIHFQIPLINDNTQNHFAVSQTFIYNFGTILKQKLGDDYVLLFSPFKISADSKIDGITIKNFSEIDLETFKKKYLGDNK